MKNSLFKRLVAMLLCLTMVFGSVPVTFAAETDGGYNQIADPSTINDWKNFFGENKGTENAGLVWTDKSVLINEQVSALGSVSASENNFLVALSAMASNKEIVGYSAIPTDTVFILDLSQSMDNGQYVPSMVGAANAAIDELLKLNKHNRISVIVYSGRSTTGTSNLEHATVLLPLERYTATDGKYIRYTGSSGDTTVSIGTNVRYEDTKLGKVEDASKQTIGGTYIQSGLYLAYQQFEDVYEKGDTVIDSELIQGGTTRMPIITLMSDGRPTVASTYYDDISKNVVTQQVGGGQGGNRPGGGNNQQTVTYTGVSTHGDGSGNGNNTLTFLTQLTAAHLKASVEEWYGTDVKFYSLWLKDENDNSANGTLQPSTSNGTLDTWWKNFLNAGKGNVVTFTEGSGNNKVEFRVTRDGVIPQVKTGTANYEAAWLAQQNYVDRTFTADDREGLISAFGDIVNEIIIQSRYYPTLVDGGDHNTDGYITIEDPIGEYMEVKQIEGIMLAVENGDSVEDVFFTGKALIDHMMSNDFGNSSTYTENGWELIRAIQQRLGVNESTAIALAQQAWRTGQLGVKNGVYSNYIGWYCDDNRNYKGFWQESHDTNDAPAGATKYVKSYGFFGELGDSQKENNLYGTQMLYIVVHVATDLDDGDQMVTLSVPASLVPVLTYSVTVDSDSLASAENASVEIKGAPGPIRLLFEVGLRDEINEITVAEAVKGHHHHTDSQGNYVFYTNRWGDDDNFDPTNASIVDKAKVAATTHYQPSLTNDRYYYTENAGVYVKNGDSYVKYSGAKPETGEFYHLIYHFDNSDENGIKEVYEVINSETLKAAESNGDGTWYIPKGTPYRALLTEYSLYKIENKTGTLPYVDDMYIYGREVSEENDNTVYEAYIFNGNNGKMTMAPAQGIKLTKVIDVVEPNTDTSFTFRVAFTDANEAVIGAGQNISYSYDGYNIQTAAIGNDGYVEIALDANKSVYIINPPADATRYIVTEVPDTDGEDYVPVYKDNAGIVYSISGDLTNGIVPVEFENGPKEPGHLIISKIVEHPFGADYTIPANKTFEVKVEFTVPQNKELGTVVVNGLAQNENATWKGNSVSFKIRHGQSVSITGITDGVGYEVTETEVENDGFELNGDLSTGLTGTIKSDATSSAVLVNEYTPNPVTGADIEIVGKKILVGRDWLPNDSFTFALSQWNGTEFVVKPVEAGSTKNVATYGNHNFTLNTAMDGVTFDRVGEYYFWVTEVQDTLGGVTYDSTFRLFTVKITDTDMDGKLEIGEVTSSDSRVGITKSDESKKWVVDVDFTNTYAPAGSAEAEVLIRKQIEKAAGVSASLAGFQFAVYDEAGNPVGSPYTTDESGFAEIKLVYGPDSLNKNETTGYYDSVTYTYHVKEVTPDVANRVDGMIYTTDYAELEVTISDDKNGGIIAETSYSFVDDNNDNVIDVKEGDIEIVEGTTRKGFVFTNKLDLDTTEVVLHGEKFLEGRNFIYDGNFISQEFAFELYQTGSDFKVVGEPLQRVNHLAVSEINASHAKFVFAPLYFGDKNVGENYYFVVKEKAGTLGGITYSNAEYHITVSVTQEEGAVKAAVSSIEVVDGTATADGDNVLSFTNVYTVSGKTEAFIVADKNLTGRVLLDGEFEMLIINEAGETVKTVKNEGTLFEERLEFDAAGEYKFTVKEKAGNLGGVTYDSAEYDVTVVVADNGYGELVADVVYEDGEIVFNNTYSAESAKVTVKGTKVLEGKDLADGQFKFNLYPTNENFTVAEGTAPITATNTNGEFGFNFTFNEPGDYYYVVYEDASEPIENIDYDESEHQIHIHVFDNYEGKLESIVKVNGTENGKVTFTNIYDEPEKPQEPEKPEKPAPTTKLTVEKVWDDKNDKEGERPDSVTLVLYSDGVRIDHVVLDEESDWTYTFTNLPVYNENGRRVRYTVAEENVPKNYSVSYNTTWLGKVIVTNTYGEELNPDTGAPGLDW